MFETPTADATVPVTNATLYFEVAASNEEVSRYPSFLDDGTPWTSQIDGAFPDNVWLLPLIGITYHLRITNALGYEPFTLTDAVPGLATLFVDDYHVDLGEIVLSPEDVNNNDIPDPWEYEHVGGLLTNDTQLLEDSDDDGHNLGQEYIAGTDPGNSNRVFQIFSITSTNTGGMLVWDAQSYRTYSVYSLPNLHSNTLESDWILETNIPCVEASINNAPIEFMLPEISTVPRKIYKVGVQISAP